MYLVLDRYYRAKHGDNSEGSFEAIYERLYDLNVEKYVGLFEYLVPEIIEQVYYNNAIWVSSPSRTETIKKVKGWNLETDIKAIFQSATDSPEKVERRKFISRLINTLSLIHI